MPGKNEDTDKRGDAQDIEPAANSGAVLIRPRGLPPTERRWLVEEIRDQQRDAMEHMLLRAAVERRST